MYRNRHLGTIRSNIDKGWNPSSFSNNTQLKFDDYKFHDNNPKTDLDNFYSYSGTFNRPEMRSFNSPFYEGLQNSINKGRGQRADIFGEQDVRSPNHSEILNSARSKFNTMQGFNELIDQGYKFNNAEKRAYNNLFKNRDAYRNYLNDGLKNF